MTTFLSALREATVEIYGVTYALDDYPATFIDAIRSREGNSVSAIVLTIEELGVSPDTAPDTLEGDS